MADNITLPGAASVVATDDVGGVHYQVVKLDMGGNGASTPVSSAMPVNPLVPATPYVLTNDANTHVPILIVSGTSNLSSLYATNLGTTAAYIHLFNKATTPAGNSDVPDMTIVLPAAASGGMTSYGLPVGFHGFRFPLGLGISISGNASYLNVAAINPGNVRVKLTRTV